MKDKKFYVKHTLLALLTLSRLPLTLIITLSILDYKKLTPSLTLFYFLTLFTDYIDGKLARNMKIESKHGAILDVGADVFFIFSTSFALYHLDSFPLWLIILIFIKLIEFLLTSSILAKREKKSKVFIFDCLGRAVSASYYLLPFLILSTKTFLTDFLHSILSQTLFYLIGLFSIIALFYRLSLVIKKEGRI